MNKKKQTPAATEEAPPAAAYPEGESSATSDRKPDRISAAKPSSAYANSTASSSGSSATTTQAPSSSSRKYTPPPFELLQNEQLVIYNVGSGDTLGGIAKKYNTTTSRIMGANGMRNTKIYAGKSLKVPTPSTARASTDNVVPIYTKPRTATASTQTPPPASTATSSYGSSAINGGYTGTTGANPTTTPAPSYVGPTTSGSPGLPSVSTSGTYTGTTASQQGVRKTKTVQPVTTTPTTTTSSSAFPTPSFSAGN